MAKRLTDYYEKTQPVIDIFERKEFVAHIDATRSKEDVFADICDHFDLPRER